MKIKSFRELEVWKLGKTIVADIYKTTKTFPDDERFGLTTQMRRCSVSIPSNIAEGFNRFNNNEYRRFLYISLGSCAELETQVEIGNDLGYIGQSERDALVEKLDHESRMIMNLIKKVNEQRATSNE
ncbi:MAG: four helix bundle protein [Omnitrophica WOR_2 bacterium RIFCSPHIGHO2_02_FULL_52_10]|nr:MAG: four helix bundle protein [Omnitrophica WOR_2 bacterium RIFCSPHIGHO2_02_FULL_52_10]